MLQDFTVATTTTVTNNPTTGGAGYYNFTVDPGTYAVMIMVPSGNTVSPSDAIGTTDNDDDINPTTGTSPSITVTSGRTNQTIDAGLYQPASLGNYVWEDAEKMVFKMEQS
jgi:hypothetical protein